VCFSCEKTHVETRCPLDPNATDALLPGDLDKMFERILADPAFQRYRPKALSRPTYAPGDTPENSDYQLGLWVLQFDDLLSPDESARLVELGQARGYKRSTNVGKLKDDGSFERDMDETRTSENTVR